MAPNYPGQIQPQPSERRDLLVSHGWIQAVAVVVLFGFFVMGLLAYRTYPLRLQFRRVWSDQLAFYSLAKIYLLASRYFFGTV